MRTKVLWGLVAAIVLSVALEYFAAHHGHAGAEYWWHEMPGFELLYGLAGAAVLTVFAKIFLFPVVKRKEGYYEDGS